MNRQLRPLPAEESSLDAERRARVSELIVAYFIRGIRALDSTPRGRSLEARRVWSARAPVASSRRGHPWE